MSDGMVLADEKFPGLRPRKVLVKLLDDVQNSGFASRGGWVDFSEFSGRGSIIFELTGSGSPTFTAQIMLSNAKDKPAATTNGPVFGSDISAAGLVNLATCPAARWIKVEPTAVSATAHVSATMHYNNA